MWNQYRPPTPPTTTTLSKFIISRRKHMYCLRNVDDQQAARINTLRPRQNGRQFTDDTYKCIFLNENVWIPIKISPKFVPNGLINNIPALVQIMAWRRPGDKPLSGPMMDRLPTHICVTWPQWFKIANMLTCVSRNMTRGTKRYDRPTCYHRENSSRIIGRSLFSMRSGLDCLCRLSMEGHLKIIYSIYCGLISQGIAYHSPTS